MPKVGAVSGPLEEAAREYLAAGLRTFPLQDHQKGPTLKWSQFRDRPIWGIDQLRAWGLPTATGLWVLVQDPWVVIDIDSDADRAYWWAQLGGLYEYAAVAKTCHGEHRWYRLAAGETGDHWGAEEGQPETFHVRGAGRGGVVVPPSVHESGITYEWVVPREAAVELPPGSGSRFRKPAAPAAQRATPLGRAARARELETLRNTTEGNRGKQLNRSALNLGQLAASGDLPREETFADLRQAALDTGLSEADTEKQLRSGFEKGEATPRSDRPQPAADLEQEVAQEVRRLLVQQRARATVRELTDPFEPPTYRANLADDLAELTDEELPYTVGRLLPVGGNATVAAQFKAGKTTLLLNLIRAAADGGRFLGAFDVDSPRRVVYVNYELSERQAGHWLREAQIRHPDRVSVLNLRGLSFRMTDRQAADWLVGYLRDMDCGLLLIDPLARMLGGVDENSNTEVAPALNALDEIRHRAGVDAGCVLATHTGRAAHGKDAERATERTRGASRLDDWPDALWVYTRDEAGSRFLSATGRDVELAESRLAFDQVSRRLTLVEEGQSRSQARVDGLVRSVVDYVHSHPGCTAREIQAEMHGNKDALGKAARKAIEDGLLRVEKKGAANLHYPAEEVRGIGTPGMQRELL